MKCVTWVAISALFIFLTCSSDPDLPAGNNTIMDGKSFLALGDSYTIGESVNEDERWPNQLVSSINTSGAISFDTPRIIARTGWRTDELIDAIEGSDLQGAYDLVSLLIGVNNQYQGVDIEIYKTEFRALLETAIEKTGGRNDHVLVLSIPDYGYTPFGESNQEQISLELDEYNAINRAISAEYEVVYVNITDISRSNDASLVASDRLHPSAAQYTAWVERVFATPAFKEYLASQAP